MSPRQGNRRRSSNKSRKRRQGGGGDQRSSGIGFWGDPGKLPPQRQDLRITDDPSAVARSLGPAPLPGHETIAEYYFAAVYDRAVGIAGALAAVGGLIKPEELSEVLDD